MSNDLKPCPFCGAQAYQRDEDPRHIWIECDECQIGTLGHSCEEYDGDILKTCEAARAAWNKRIGARP